MRDEMCCRGGLRESTYIPTLYTYIHTYIHTYLKYYVLRYLNGEPHRQKNICNDPKPCSLP